MPSRRWAPSGSNRRPTDQWSVLGPFRGRRLCPEFPGISGFLISYGLVGLPSYFLKCVQNVGTGVVIDGRRLCDVSGHLYRSSHRRHRTSPGVHPEASGGRLSRPHRRVRRRWPPRDRERSEHPESPTWCRLSRPCDPPELRFPREAMMRGRARISRTASPSSVGLFDSLPRSQHHSCTIWPPTRYQPPRTILDTARIPRQEASCLGVMSRRTMGSTRHPSAARGSGRPPGDGSSVPGPAGGQCFPESRSCPVGTGPWSVNVFSDVTPRATRAFFCAVRSWSLVDTRAYPMRSPVIVLNVQVRPRAGIFSGGSYGNWPAAETRRS